MVWLLRQRLRFFLRSSLWFYPLLSIGAALFAAPALRRVDDWTGWTLPISIDGVRAVVGTLTKSMQLLTFIVFVFLRCCWWRCRSPRAQLYPRV